MSLSPVHQSYHLHAQGLKPVKPLEWVPLTLHNHTLAQSEVIMLTCSLNPDVDTSFRWVRHTIPTKGNSRTASSNNTPTSCYIHTKYNLVHPSPQSIELNSSSALQTLIHQIWRTCCYLLCLCCNKLAWKISLTEWLHRRLILKKRMCTRLYSGGKAHMDCMHPNKGRAGK